MKNVLVTGGSRGIGAAICRELAADHFVYVGATTLAAAQALAQTLPNAAPWVADLTDETATNQAISQLDRLDVLVNNAGRYTPGNLGDFTRDSWRRDLELNLIAPMDLTRRCLPLLRQNTGQIVFINSGAGFEARLGSALYSASKFGLRALADRIREEERGRVRVTSIHPGRVDTEMQQTLQADKPSYRPQDHLSADAVAKTVRLALDAPPNAMVETLSIRPVQQL